MHIDIPYGKKDALSAELPDTLDIAFLEANEVPTGDAVDMTRKALDSPVGKRRLNDFLENARDVLLVVNDATRPTPTKQILDVIMEQVRKIPFHAIIATGAHRGPTEEEYLQIFGNHYPEIKDRIIVHDARKDEDMVFLGTSSNGTEMTLNKAAVNAHRIIVIGSVEPHYFAGYTGGRKSLLPGIAGFKTIEQNHKLALSPKAKALSLQGNPVAEDMEDALKTIKNDIFAIMTVLDKDHGIYAVRAGDIRASFSAATEKANDVFAVSIEKKADIVVSVVKFPMDIDLYQAQKGIDNAKLALKPNGILILVAECRDGIGGKAFAELLSSCDTPKAVLETIEQGYRLGYHKAAKMAEIGLWAETWAVTGVAPDILQSLFIRPFATIQDALDKAIEAKGSDAHVLFLMDGGLTVPMLT